MISSISLVWWFDDNLPKNRRYCLVGTTSDQVNFYVSFPGLPIPKNGLICDVMPRQITIRSTRFTESI